MNHHQTSQITPVAVSLFAPFRSHFSSRKEQEMTTTAGLDLFSMTDPWYVDRERSSIGFCVKQRMIEPIWGRFGDFDGRIEPGQPPRIVGSVRVASLSTDHPLRDEQLRSTLLFDARRYPVIGFASNTVAFGRDDSLLVSADLTIRGITRPVVLEGEFHGASVDPDGRPRLGLALRGNASRSAFELCLNRSPEADSLIVADDIALVIDIVVGRGELGRAA
jgi:polyisoprenoid-binding protein YceI